MFYHVRNAERSAPAPRRRYHVLPCTTSEIPALFCHSLPAPRRTAPPTLAERPWSCIREPDLPSVHDDIRLRVGERAHAPSRWRRNRFQETIYIRESGRGCCRRRGLRCGRVAPHRPRCLLLVGLSRREVCWREVCRRAHRDGQAARPLDLGRSHNRAAWKFPHHRRPGSRLRVALPGGRSWRADRLLVLLLDQHDVHRQRVRLAAERRPRGVRDVHRRSLRRRRQPRPRSSELRQV